jgi:hypothetical protein
MKSWTLPFLHVVVVVLIMTSLSQSTAQIGGSINEKVRHCRNEMANSDSNGKNESFFDRHCRAHLLHALEGLDRYPNYLNRWNEKDITELELSLQDKIEKVREQKIAILKQRNAIVALCQQQQQAELLLHPNLQKPNSWEELQEKILDPSFYRAIIESRKFQKNLPPLEDVLSGNVAVELDAHKLESIVDPEVFDVYSMPLFQTSFCDIIRSYIRSLSLMGDISLKMRTRPTDLDTIELSWINDLLLHLVARPLSRHLYQASECEGGDLDWRHGYVTMYSPSPSDGRNNRLIIHTDDSEVTLNIGLGDDTFQGGMVELWGLRGEYDRNLLGDYQPIKGRVLIHAGRHFHQVTPVTNGERYALILWTRSLRGIRSQMCPCCWLNRRLDKSCTCGAKWN